MSVCLESVSKSFGDTLAVDNVSFEAGTGEFFVVIGPTGCGKTTILKLIAGLIRPDSGNIIFGGMNVNELPPEARRVRMVFQGQDYALWPHMKIYDEKRYTNLSFSLKIRKYLPRRIRNIVEGVSDQVGIERESYTIETRATLSRPEAEDCGGPSIDDPPPPRVPLRRTAG
jgi:ABC-type sugar transport system ATPase subunit